MTNMILDNQVTFKDYFKYLLFSYEMQIFKWCFLG